MAKKKKSELIVEHICQRFLNPDMGYTPDQFPTIDKILDLPVYALKAIKPEDATIYADIFGIKSIRDMATLDYNHPLNRLIPAQTTPDIDAHLEMVENILAKARQRIGDVEKLRNTVLISKMISDSWQKRATYLEKQETKVITIGLDNAGKTAILSSLGGKMGLTELADLKPTKRIERRTVSAGSLSMLLWDFGGQADYRELYLNEPEKYFIRTDMIIYVIDMQDSDRYDLSFEYFSQILQIMLRLSEKPYVLCFLHKSDPELMQDPDFQFQLDFVKEKIKFMMKELPFDYDIYATSIYNFFSNEPKFSKFIKDVMKEHQSLADPTMEKIQGLGKIVDTALNGIISLASSVNDQISQVQYRLDGIERSIAGIYQHLESAQKVAAQSASIVKSQPVEIQKKLLQAAVAVPLNPPPGVSANNPNFKEIEQRAMASRQTLSQLQDTSKGLVDSANRTRSTILQELQVLFQKTKKLD